MVEFLGLFGQEFRLAEQIFVELFGRDNLLTARTGVGTTARGNKEQSTTQSRHFDPDPNTPNPSVISSFYSSDFSLCTEPSFREPSTHSNIFSAWRRKRDDKLTARYFLFLILADEAVRANSLVAGPESVTVTVAVSTMLY